MQRGDTIPHFEVTTADGHRVRYAELWQQRNLVLMTLPDRGGEAARNYVAEMKARLGELRPDDTRLVAVAGAVENLPRASLIISDRWGEVVHVTPLSSDVASWPAPDDVIEWVQFVRMQCPECPP